MKNKYIFFKKSIKIDVPINDIFTFYYMDSYGISTTVSSIPSSITIIEEENFDFMVQNIKKNFPIISNEIKSMDISFIGYTIYNEDLYNFFNQDCTIIQVYNYRNDVIENCNYKIHINEIKNIKSILRNIKINQIINE